IVELLPPATNWLEHIWYNISWNTIPTDSVRLRQKIRYLKHRKHWLFAIQTIAWLLGHLHVWRELLRKVYAIIPDNYIDNLFETYKPDLVFAPNMFSPEDCRVLRAA